MSEIDRLAEHQWTAANDAVDIGGFAGSNRFLRYAPITNRSMKAHPRNTGVDALANHINRDVAARDNHHTI